MTGGAGAPKETARERLYLFGIRQLVLVIAIAAVGIYLVLAGAIYGPIENLIGGTIIVLIALGLWYGFKTTAVHKISKRYYSMETIVGKEGVAKSRFDAGSKGVVNVDNEYWSAVTEERIIEGADIVVTAVEPDKVTLRVRRAKDR